MARPAEISKEKILQVAREVFFEKGIAAAEMTDIAAQCGVSRSTLYRRFESKEALALSVSSGILGTMDAALERMLAEDGRGSEVVRRALEAYVASLEQNLAEIRFLVDFDAYFPGGYPDTPPAETYMQQNRRGGEGLARALRRGMADGSIRPLRDPGFTARFMQNTLMSVAQRVLPRADILRREQGYALEYLHETLRLLLRDLEPNEEPK